MDLATLQQRANNQCELCNATDQLKSYQLQPETNVVSDSELYLCEKCINQIEKKEELDGNHWQCLTSSMWSEHPAVQVAAWRMLNRLRNESWAADNLDMLYLDDELLSWAKQSGDHENDASIDIHKDSNGHPLENGDSVVLIKSLDVKGSTVNARLGTVIKNIRLDPNDTGYIEGKIEGQSIMIKTEFIRKQGAQIIT